jgi:ATP-binding cassette, subfamily G (WHITE), member 1
MSADSIELRNIVLEVKNKSTDSRASEYKRLLNGLSTTFDSGKVTAIMGPSGSCKTTLITLLAGRVEESSCTGGEILYMGKEREIGRWLDQIAFLEQDDCIVPGQSVHDFIKFSLSCKMKGATPKEVEAIADGIMESLEISGLKNTKLDVISGGERKRVMIAVELALKPDVLILDEPTSGLDSHLALELTQMVKEYASKHNKFVIMTVHQPGPGLFELIDHLLFLCQGSKIYDGPANECEKFLGSYGMVVSNRLSTSEFLFELFTDRSVFPEIREYKGKVQQLVADAKEREKKTLSSVALRRSNDVFYDMRLEVGKAFMLTKRQIKLNASSILRFLSFLILKAMPLALIGAVIVNRMKEAKDNSGNRSSSSGESTFFDFTLSKIFYKNALGPEVAALGTFLNVTAGFMPIALVFFNYVASGFMNDTSFLHRETTKGYYTPMSLYLGFVMAELFDIMACGFLFFTIFFSFGLLSMHTIIILLSYFIVSSLMLKLVAVLVNSVAHKGFFYVALSSVQLSLFLISPTALVIVLTEKYEKNLLAKAALNLKYLLFLWGYMFFDCFMGRIAYTRLERVLASLTDSYKNHEDYQRYYEQISKAAEASKKGEYTKWFGKKGYPVFLEPVFTATAAAGIIALTVFTLYYKFKPNLRLKLSSH